MYGQLDCLSAAVDLCFSAYWLNDGHGYGTRRKVDVFSVDRHSRAKLHRRARWGAYVARGQQKRHSGSAGTAALYSGIDFRDDCRFIQPGHPPVWNGRSLAAAWIAMPDAA